MIELHRLNDSAIFLNYRHIEIIEAKPHTVITLTNERKYIVKETPQEIALLIEEYHKKIFRINFQESVDV